MRCIAAMMLAAALCSCGGPSDKPAVPRRHAYPRMAVPAAVQVDTAVGGHRFKAEVHGQPAVPRPDWLDISYPGATLHLSVTTLPPARLAGEMVNRRERMALNLAGAPARTAHFSSADGVYEYVLLTAEAPVLTPVLVLGTDGHSRLINGALELHDAPAANAADSLAPLLQLITDDLTRLLSK